MNALELSSWVSVRGRHSTPFEGFLHKVVSADPVLTRAAPSAVTVLSRLSKRFDGDDWKSLLASIPSLLRQTFVCEASNALGVGQEAITDVQFRLGSLYVTFHVTHDEDISQEEMDRRIEEYPFREMWRLYNQRDGAPDGLDAALQRLKEVEVELKDKTLEWEKQHSENEQKVKELEKKLHALENEMEGPVAEREQDLLQQLGREQGARKKVESQLKASDDMNKKLLESLKQEKMRAEKTAQRHNDLIAAIIQENKKEKEAKEREYNEQIEVKDYIIENFKSQLRSRANGSASPRNSIVDADQSEEFNRLMKRMEDMAAVLQRTQESESEARAQIRHLSDALKQSEEARQSELVSYDNNMVARTQEFHSYRDKKIAEDNEGRFTEYCESDCDRIGDGVKESTTIMRQYIDSLGDLVGSLQDRLHSISEEYNSDFTKTVPTLRVRQILDELRKGNVKFKETLQSSLFAIQHHWETQEPEARKILKGIEAVIEDSERSRGDVDRAISIIDSNTRAFEDHKDWTEQQQKMLSELLCSLRDLNRQVFDLPSPADP
ncbi:hypothetical protein JKF63_01827 [Porcisia hertigi]|uniref:Flagellar attachment zone protein 1 conserved domain-containing protein n=1 Tax=Porcisia hertigi TaxID=2761500 RepID=A0A836HJP9_9TRYP|nr:hypothetical protein JKF63_01827 [Porcisia hertigi]